MQPFIWPKPFRYFENVQFFLISICLIMAAVLIAIFSFLYNQTDALLLQRVKEHAVTYVDLLNHTKTWNYNYGGVYVEKKPGVESNAYLKGIIDPDIHAEKGKTLTIRNHAIMIKEISRRSEIQGGGQVQDCQPSSRRPLQHGGRTGGDRSQEVREGDEGALPGRGG